MPAMTTEPETTPAQARDHLPFWGVVAITAVAVIAVVAALIAPAPPAPALTPGPGPAGPINTKIAGLTTFRGNAARTLLRRGTGPLRPGEALDPPERQHEDVRRFSRGRPGVAGEAVVWHRVDRPAERRRRTATDR